MLIPAAVLLIISLLLFLYGIRSVIFLAVSKKAIRTHNKDFLCKNFYRTTTSSRLVSETMAHESDLSSLGAEQVSRNEDSSFRTLSQKKNSRNDTICTDGKPCSDISPFISILIPTYNESLVIHNLMTSCSNLSYERSRYEIIIVDDSTDNTFDLLKQWENKISNLKLIHRIERIGWKGGALNFAIKNMNPESSYALVVDADNVLVSDTLERFISCFQHHNNKCTYVIQGFPVSKINPAGYINYIGNNVNSDETIRTRSNWVADAIDFRLMQRNLVEFAAKDYLKLPVQVIGSLFMIRSEVIRTLEFSNDLTEDWDLTLDLNLRPELKSYDHNNNCISERKSKKVSFNPLLISYCETTTKVKEYFKQRFRVSEGHTRGFRKRVWTILTSNIPTIDKIEFFFLGFHFAKFIAILALIILDLFFVPLILWNDKNLEKSTYLIEVSLIVQLSNTLIVIVTGIMSILLSRSIGVYSIKNILYLLLLNLIVMPAIVLGAMMGFCRKKGKFYRTERNIIQ